jgi:hypothetical protein
MDELSSAFPRGSFAQAANIVGGRPNKEISSAKGAQLGTLGGGNHFIELCLDESQDVWVMLHSGSRGIGNMIGRHFIERAKACEKHFITLPDKDLAYFPEGHDRVRRLRRRPSAGRRTTRREPPRDDGGGAAQPAPPHREAVRGHDRRRSTATTTTSSARTTSARTSG